MKPMKQIKILSALLSLAGLLTLSAGCEKPQPKEPDPVKLAAPAPKITNITTTTAEVGWELVPKALTYEIFLNDEGTPFRGNGPSYVLSDLTADTEYTVTMRSIPMDQSELLLPSDLSEPVKFRTAPKAKLDTPVFKTPIVSTTTITFSWVHIEVIANLGHYNYTLNGGEIKTTNESYVEFTDLEINTEYTFRIQAVPADHLLGIMTDSDWSELIVSTKDLAALNAPEPTLASKTSTTAKISWGGIANAESYTYKLGENGDEGSTTERSIEFTALSPETEYTAYVKAVPAADQKLYAESSWAPVKFTTDARAALETPSPKVGSATPTSLRIFWDAVPNAVKYVYTVNGGSQVTTNLTSCNIINLQHSTEYTIRVKAVPSAANADLYVDSAWGEVKGKTAIPAKLSTPVPELTASTTTTATIYWVVVGNAMSYEYKLGENGEVHSTNNSQVTLTDLTVSTDYVFYVRALPGATDVNHVASDWAVFNFNTKDRTPLETPTLSLASGPEAHSAAVTWSEVANAVSYVWKLGANGVENSTTGRTATLSNLDSDTTYTIYVRAIPEADSENYTVSAWAEGSFTTKKADTNSNEDYGRTDGQW